MFYSYDILNIRNGKLSVAWLAATGRLKPCTKKSDKHFRETMNVVVYKICEAIMNRIPSYERALGSEREMREHIRGRFSLYLSSMLMSGTVRIYRSQVAVLYDSVSMFLELAISESLYDHTSLQPKKKKKKQLQQGETEFPQDIFFGATNLDFENLEMPVAVSVCSKSSELVTPRKRSSVKKGTREDVRDILRVNEEKEEDDIHQLLQEWTDPMQYPNVANIRDITIMEEHHLLRPGALSYLETSKLGPFEEPSLGPLGFIPPEDYLRSKEREETSEVQAVEIQVNKGKQATVQRIAGKEQEILEENQFDKRKQIQVDNDQEVVVKGIIDKQQQATDGDQLDKEQQITEEGKIDEFQQVAVEGQVDKEQEHIVEPLLKDVDQQTIVQSEITEAPIPIQETPAQLIVRTEQPPRKVKGKKPPTDPVLEVTVAPETREPAVKVTRALKTLQPSISKEKSPILLGQVEEVRPKPKRTMIKRKFVDEKTQIPQSVIKVQTMNYGDTMRELISSCDIINAHWWNVMKGASQLFRKYQRAPISDRLKTLVSRHYIAKPQDEFYEREGPVQRQFPNEREISMISHASSLTLDASKSSADRSHTGTISHLEIPVSLPPPQSDLVQLRPIQAIKPSVLFSDLDFGESERIPHDGPKSAAQDILEEAEKRRERNLIPSPDEGFSLVTVSAEVHKEPNWAKRSEVSPNIDDSEPKGKLLHQEDMSPHKKLKTLLPEDVSSAQYILQEAEKSRDKKRVRSPDEGFSFHAVSAEVHAEPTYIMKPTDQEELPAPKRHKILFPEVSDITSPAQHILDEVDKKREERRVPSPDEGFAYGILTAEIHAQPAPSSRIETRVDQSSVVPSLIGETSSSFLYPQDPYADFEKIDKLGLSPVGRPRISRVVTTPELLEKEREFLLISAMEGKKRLQLKDLFSINPTRREVAVVFAQVLKMHKEKMVILSQEKSFGKIFIDTQF